MAFGDTGQSYDPAVMQAWLANSVGRATGNSPEELIIRQAHQSVQQGEDVGKALRKAASDIGTTAQEMRTVAVSLAKFFGQGTSPPGAGGQTFAALNPHYGAPRSELYDAKLKVQADALNAQGQRGIEIAREQLRVQQMSLEIARQERRNMNAARWGEGTLTTRLANARDSYRDSVEANRYISGPARGAMFGMGGALAAAASAASPDIIGTIGLNARLLASDIGSDPAFAKAAVRISGFLADLRTGWRQLAPETRDASINLAMKGTLGAAAIYGMYRFGIPAMSGAGSMMGFSSSGMASAGMMASRLFLPLAIGYGAYEFANTMREPFRQGADANITRIMSPSRPAGHNVNLESSEYSRILAVMRSGNQSAMMRELTSASGFTGNLLGAQNPVFQAAGVNSQNEFFADPERAARVLARFRSSGSDRASAVLGAFENHIPFIEVGGGNLRYNERLRGLVNAGFRPQDIQIAMRSSGLTDLAGTLAEPNLGQERIQSFSRSLSDTVNRRAALVSIMEDAGLTGAQRRARIQSEFGLNARQVRESGGTLLELSRAAVPLSVDNSPENQARQARLRDMFSNLMAQRGGGGRLADLEAQRAAIMESHPFQSRQFAIESLHDIIQQQAVRPQGEQELFTNMTRALENLHKAISEENARRATQQPVAPAPLPTLPPGWNRGN